MASGSQGLRIAVQVVLAIVIVVLAYVLYVSITEPYEAIERQRELTERTRVRMSDVRTALIRYDRQNDRFPGSLDSLTMFVRTDSLLSMKADSIFGDDFVLDSLVYSPRSGRMFEYAVNDTGRVATYLLKDPDSDDQIGTLSGDPTLLNAASWE